jgi:hypothetical protein
MCANLAHMKKSNTKEFISKAIKIHGDKYDYSESEYIDCNTKIKIFCKKHNKYFYQNANNHLQGQQCSCGRSERIGIGNSKYNQKSFIKKVISVHGDKYDYSLVSYNNVTTKVKIICKKHNYVFEQLPYTHLRGAGCPKCAIDKTVSYTRSNKFYFIEKAKIVHGDRYCYDLVKYKNNSTRVKIICRNHDIDFIFEQTPQKHLSGRGCPICNSSEGENIIRGFLLNNNIKFEEQKRFKDCIFKGFLSFDFFVPDKNIVIEYNGVQHYENNIFFHRNEKYDLSYQKKRDGIKRKYCGNNNIFLLEIPYWEKNNINKILSERLDL